MASMATTFTDEKHRHCTNFNRGHFRRYPAFKYYERFLERLNDGTVAFRPDTRTYFYVVQINYEKLSNRTVSTVNLETTVYVCKFACLFHFSFNKCFFGILSVILVVINIYFMEQFMTDNISQSDAVYVGLAIFFVLYFAFVFYLVFIRYLHKLNIV